MTSSNFSIISLTPIHFTREGKLYREAKDRDFAKLRILAEKTGNAYLALVVDRFSCLGEEDALYSWEDFAAFEDYFAENAEEYNQRFCYYYC